MVIIVQDIHERQDTLCYEVLTKLHTICFLNISNFKFIHENLTVGAGLRKNAYLSSARCAHCMLRYL